MPHQPRAVSPVALETCASQTSEWEADPYELLGSDDDLDDTARDAKRRRIEKLAESYLRGRPLFIASGALRGPFDDGWRNPWRKERRIVKKAGVQSSSKTDRLRKREACVQETDPGNERHKSALTRVGSSEPTTDSYVSARETKSPSVFMPAQKGNNTHERIFVPTRESPSLPKRPREESLTVEEHTFIEPGSVDWLRKDKKRMNFKSFEPPTSPTPKGAQRKLAEPRSRDTASASASRSVAPVSPRVPSFSSPRRTKTPAKDQHSKTVGDANLRAPRSASKNPQTVPSPAAPVASPRNTDKGASFQVVSSTSQLSRFEYRRLREPRSSPRLELISPAMGSKAAEAAPSHQAIDHEDVNMAPVDNDLNMAEPEGVPEEDLAPEVDAAKVNNAQGREPSVHLSKSIRFADDTERQNSSSTYQPPPTEPNTYEDLPSAQEVPVPPGVSDRVTSLHSTAVPKEPSHNDADIESTPDTQLSTQAALFQAQKSFQDDLESPIRSYGITPGQQNMDPGDESLLARETPLFRPDTSERALPRQSRLSELGRANAMSTQCMIDAATPFDFSTEKKPRPFRSISPPKTHSVKPRAIHTSKAVSFGGSPPPDQEEDESALRSYSGSPTPYPPNNHSSNSNAHPSTNQATTSLPFALSGSTHDTPQDGQIVQHPDSFNLSQAIADAGSWLQQSFEIVARPSQEHVSSEAQSRL